MDDLDAAQSADAADREAALARRRLQRSAADSVVGRKTCSDCSDPIPKARRKAVPACTRCIACQRDEDNRAARAER